MLSGEHHFWLPNMHWFCFMDIAIDSLDARKTSLVNQTLFNSVQVLHLHKNRLGLAVVKTVKELGSTKTLQCFLWTHKHNGTLREVANREERKTEKDTHFCVNRWCVVIFFVPRRSSFPP